MKLYFIVIATLVFYFNTEAHASIKWERFQGTIYLQNKDSLSGEILLYATSGGELLVKTKFLGFAIESSNKTDSVKWIKYKDIKRVDVKLAERLAPFTYEYLPYQNKLWRVLKETESVAIYADMILPRWGLQYAPKKMILLSGKDTVIMYSGLTWFFHNSKTKPLLRNFINRRYKYSFKKEDFKDEDEQLNYIAKHG